MFKGKPYTQPNKVDATQTRTITSHPNGIQDIIKNKTKQRNVFANAVDKWHEMSEEERESWRLKAYGLKASGFNLFVGTRMKEQRSREFDEKNRVAVYDENYTNKMKNQKEIQEYNIKAKAKGGKLKCPQTNKKIFCDYCREC